MRYCYIFFYIFFQSFYAISQPTIKWVFDTKDASFGQSAAADLDGDGVLEVVFGCYRNDSMIYALNAENGTLLWKFNAGTATTEGCNDVAPLIFDVDGDGSLEVIVPSSCNPKTYCFNGKTGALKWVCNTRGSDSPPTIADVDGDGKLEILHGEFGGYVICIDAISGIKKWELSIDTNSWIQTAPSILDINNDGDLDFIVATWNNVDTLNNKVYAIRAKDKKVLWPHNLSKYVYHGSAIGDIDNDGILEVIIGSYNDTLYCLNANTGKPKWKFSLGNYFYVGGPTQIADVDNDGQCEIIFTAWYSVVVLDNNGVQKWKYNIPNYGQSFRGAAVADVNNDAYLDIILGTDKGTLIALHGNSGLPIFNFNMRSHYGDSLFKLDHAPLIADFDKDGNLDVFIVGGHAEYPNFYKDFGRAYMLSIGKGKGPDWLMFQNDVHRNSNICKNESTLIKLSKVNNRQLTLIPNPVRNKAEISIYLEKETILSIEIYNYIGQLVDKVNGLPFNAKQNTIDWYNNKNLPVGFYFLKVTNHADINETIKFQIQ